MMSEPVAEADDNEARFSADVAAIQKMQVVMLEALSQLVEAMERDAALPEDVLFCIVTAELEILGRTLGSDYLNPDRDDIFAFVRDEGLLVIEGAMRSMEKLARESVKP